MEQFFFENFGISPEVLNYVVLPLLIFFARIGDVSIATIRMIFVMSGRKVIAPILGFFESLIWLLAIGQIFNNIDNVWSYVAYAGGYATGTFVGMYIEEKLALGRVVVRIITKLPANDLINFLKEKDYRYSSLDAEGNSGRVNVIFTVIKREFLKELIPGIKITNPNAFYTIEGVKKVSDEDLVANNSSGIGLRWFTLRRK